MIWMIGWRKRIAWLPRKPSGFIDSRKNSAAVVRRRRAMPSASLSSSARSSSSSAASRASSASASVATRHLDAPAQLRHHGVAVGAVEQQQEAAVAVEPARPREGGHQRAARPDLHPAQVLPAARAPDAEPALLDAGVAQPVVGGKQER